MCERGGKQVHRDRPPAKQFPANLLAKSPLGAQDLRTPTERIGQYIQVPRNELREETDGVDLAEPENRLSHGTEGRRSRAPLLSKIRQSCGVVQKQSNRLMLKQVTEPTES